MESLISVYAAPYIYGKIRYGVWYGVWYGAKNWKLAFFASKGHSGSFLHNTNVVIHISPTSN